MSLNASSIDLRLIVQKIREAIGRIEVDCHVGGPRCNEENVKLEIESILWNEVWSKLGVEKPVYERLLGKGVLARSYKRADAFYGLTIFEYKTPKIDLARSAKERGEALRQVSEYISLALKEPDVQNLVETIKFKGLTPLIFGIVTNGKQVVFVEYNVDAGVLRVDPVTGAYPLDEVALRRIVVAVTSSWKKRFTAENLASDFGYRAILAKRAIRKLYEKLVSPKSDKTKVLFNEWGKTVSIAYPKFGEEIRNVADLYGFRGDVDGDRLFFAIQTYYSIVLKLVAAEIASKFYNTSILAYLDYLGKVRDPNEFRRAFERIESGELFASLGIRNFAERSFFSWYLEEWDEEIERLLRDIIAKLSEYDISSVYLSVESARDILKVLYEELIPRKEVRQKLGIYATPDWLAELIIRESGLAEKLSHPCSVRVLDPGCGTGTFLSLAIQEVGKRAKLCEETLKCVTRNIVGFDIEPLAVLTAKTNYLIALAATGSLNYRRGEIEIPIYMANSLLPIEFECTLVDNVQVVKVETSIGAFLIPERLVKEGLVTGFLDDLKEAINLGLGIEKLVAKYKLSSGEFKIVRELYAKILELKNKGVDTIWIPVIKSYLAPLAFLNSFDYIIGNPPWLAYRYLADPRYQSIIKRMIKDVYSLVLDEHLMTHMELATLFFVRSADKYLKDGGIIGFVMPRAIFSADQHDAFRGSKFAGVKIGFKKIVDCEKVEPLFYVPTCVVIAKKGEDTEFPVEGYIVKGKLPEQIHKVLPLDEALKCLSIEKVKFYYNRIGARSFLDTKEVTIKPRRSWYYPYFYQGATIVPQSCWFVDIVDASKPDVVVVQSSKRSTVRGKIRETLPPMPVEREFIYGVLTSAEVLPFAHLPPNIAVLPIRPRGESYELITRELAAKLGYKHLAKWLEEAEKIWDKIRGAKKENLYNWLDYQRKLTSQSSKAKYRVVYLRSATYLAACIVKNEPIEIEWMKSIVKLNGILVDATLYRYDTDNEDEAFYLVAVFNSSLLDELIKPVQSRGQFGPRDIHKKPLEFPIPKYDHGNDIHRKLSELGRKAAQKVYEILPGILKKFGYDAKLKQRGFLMPQEVGRVRGAIRSEIQELINEIDLLVQTLLAIESSKGLGGLLKYFKKG